MYIVPLTRHSIKSLPLCFLKSFPPFWRMQFCVWNLCLLWVTLTFHLYENADTRRFCQILTLFGLQQHVSVPTHVSGHTLDVLISRSVADFSLGVPMVTWLLCQNLARSFKLKHTSLTHQNSCLRRSTRVIIFRNHLVNFRNKETQP